MFKVDKISNPQFKKKSSPAKPVYGTPPRAGTRAFFFNDAEKEVGLTPGGRHTVKLSRYEGRSHQWVSTVTTPERLYRGDSTLVSPDKHNFERLSLILFMKLKNLKNRTDKDYNVKINQGEIESGHYLSSTISISECISSVKKCYKMAPDRHEFLREINQEILSKNIYNPFGLDRIYGIDISEYNLALAQDESIYLALVTVSNCSVSKSFKFGDIDLNLKANISTTQPSRSPAFRGLYDDLPSLVSASSKKSLPSIEPGELATKLEDDERDLLAQADSPTSSFKK